jgi:hypothetical protein
MGLPTTELETPARGWDRWTLYEWAEALLGHYFERDDDDEGAVRALVVVGEELARAVGDPEADPDAIETALVGAVVRGVGDRGFWNHARERARFARPYYFPHLVVACLAATELEDSEEDEGSYIRRLDELTFPARASLNLEIMPGLWANLETWLNAHADGYRSLRLPDPGGWTRIGQTVKLAFPSRRDQRALVRRLVTQDLLQPDPPVGPVLNTIDTARRSDFSPRFWSAFEEFKRERSVGTTLADLRASPFWSAVRATAGTERSTSSEDAGTQWALVGSDDGYDIEFSIVCNCQADIADGRVQTLDERLNGWTHVLALDSSTESAVAALLQERLRLPQLTNLVRGGVIPFVEGLHGELESGSRRNLDEANVALVDQTRVDDVVAQFGSPRTYRQESRFDGWTVVRNISLKATTAEELRGTTLDTSWVLHEALAPPAIYVRGGIRVGHAWLGVKELLPIVRVPQTSAITATQAGTSLRLEALGDDKWCFSSNDLSGTILLEAEVSGRSVRRELQFVLAVSHEHFRMPKDAAHWVYEDQARARTFVERWNSEAELIPIEDAAETIVLGRDIGTFPTSDESAAWAIHTFGSDVWLRPLAGYEELKPRAMTANVSARRKWRKLLSDANDHVDDELLKRIVNAAVRDGTLPIAERADQVPEPPVEPASPHAQLGRLVTAMVAVSNSRAGLEMRHFKDLVVRMMGVAPAFTRAIVRAWQEADLIDELVRVTWSGRRIHAVRPLLAVFELDGGCRAILRGLVLPTTIADLCQAARNVGVSTAPVGSPSPFVPRSVHFRAERFSQIEGLADAFGLPVVRLGPQPFASSDGWDLFGERPTVGYHFTPEQAPDEGTTFRRYWRSQGPSYWTVQRGRVATWSHFREAALFWAQALAGGPTVDEIGERDFEVASCHVPLAAARWLSSLGGGLSGPTAEDADSPYLYRAPSRALRARFLAEMQEFASATLTRLDDGNGGTCAHA